MLSDSFIYLEGVRFEVRRWDPARDDGFRLRSIWVRIEGFPIKLWHRHEFERLVEDFAVVLDLDQATERLRDYTAAKVRLGVCDPRQIPTVQWIRFKNRRNEWRSYQVRYTVLLPRGFGTGGGGNGGPGAGNGGTGGQGGYGGQGNNKFRKIWKEKSKGGEGNSHNSSPGEDLLDEEDREDRRKIGSRRNETAETEKQGEPVLEEIGFIEKRVEVSSLQSKPQVENCIEVLSQQSPNLVTNSLTQGVQKKGKTVEESETVSSVLQVVPKKGEGRSEYAQKEIIPVGGYPEERVSDGLVMRQLMGNSKLKELSQPKQVIETPQRESSPKINGENTKSGEEDWTVITPSHKAITLESGGTKTRKGVKIAETYQSPPVVTINRFEVLEEDVG